MPAHPVGVAAAAAAAVVLSAVVVVAPTSVAAASPPVPCADGTTTTSYSQPTPVPVPTGPAVVSSTITVLGSSTYLTDADVTTDLTHTFAADLDVTVTSPAGTVVTLTTDNGAGNDNVFDGTVWDDDANPGGQVPYTTNNGMVTDQVYANLTPVATLTPEEPLGAFIGEDPNGTWTLTVSDDLAGDGGTLDGWALALTAQQPPPVLTAQPLASQTTDVPVPTGPAVVTSTVDVAGAGSYLSDADVTTDLTHTFSADLDVTVTSPAGTVVTLTTDNGAGNDDVFNGTVWDDDANPGGQVPYTTNNGMVTDQVYANLTPVATLTPEEPLGAFIGEDPNGTWTLTVSDDLAGDGGTILGWALALDTGVCDYAVTGAKVKAKRPKVKAGSKFKVSSEVRATLEPLTSSVTGKVKVRLPNGKQATYKLTGATKPASLGGTAKFKQVLVGSQAKAAKARATMLEALRAKRKVVVKLTFVITDDAGNKTKVKKTVKVKKG